VVEAMKEVLTDHSVITADAGYHSEANLQKLAAMKVEALIADNGMRQRDERFATVEPVFGNLRYNKELDRFTLRGPVKVDAQWKLFCLVHNIEKLAHHGYAQ
jgi:IS5 family transposase